MKNFATSMSKNIKTTDDRSVQDRLIATLLVPGVILIAALASLSTASKANAQVVYIEGPLAGQPAVRNMRLYREKRVHLKPFFGFTLQDEYSKAFLFGAQVGYYFTDWIGIDALFGYAPAQAKTDLTKEIENQGQTTDVNALSLPSRERFSDQIGQIDWMAGAQVTFIPLRGKLSLFQKVFLDTDFYVFGGVAAVGVEERASVTDPSICGTAPPAGADETNACIATQLERSSRVAIAPTFGIGLTMYINEWSGIFLEWRGLPFAWNTSGTDERGDPRGGFPDGVLDSEDRIFHFNHMMTIGATFALPTKTKITE